MKKISIGIPCYNEEQNIEQMYFAVSEQMRTLKEYDYEIIFSDNASKDNSADILRKLAQKDNRVKVIINRSNVGVYRSTVNCYKNATGDAYIGIPCDFQEPPEMIPTFVSEWEKGNEIVWGQKNSSNESKIKFWCRKIYYNIMDFWADYPQMKQADGFGIMDRKAVDFLLSIQLQDPQLTARQLFPEFGFSVKLIPYRQMNRKGGKSSYNLMRYWDFAVVSLCNSSTKILHMITLLGAVMSSLCLGTSFFYFISKLLSWDNFVNGMAPAVVGLFLVSSFQLLFLGLIGEYLLILLRRVTKKPLVIEQERINF